MIEYKSFISVSIILVSISFTLLLTTCGKNGNVKETIYSERDKNIEKVDIVSIEELLPPLHSGAFPMIFGDTMIINDYRSTTLVFAAFDLKKNRYIGSFGRYGNGPGEIARYCNNFFNPHDRKMYGLNLAQWNISGFEIDKAIGDSTYLAEVETALDEHGKMNFVKDAFIINDSLIYCALQVPDETMSLSTRIAVQNYRAGELRVIDKLGNETRSRYKLVVLPEENRFMTFGYTHDRIRLFDLEGNLIKTILGPDFSDTHDGHTYYFTSTAVSKDYVYVVYSGEDAHKQSVGHDIVVTDHSGNYVKTLRVEYPITGLAYHERTNRLYLGTVGEPQFGYIQL